MLRLPDPLPRTDLPALPSELGTVAATGESQRDLDALCAEREWTTAEVFPANAAYGHDLVLKTVAGLPADYALKVALQHGVETEAHPAGFHPRELVPVITYAYEPRRAFYADLGAHRVWPMASPFLYAEQLVERPADRAGTIVFPSHSSVQVTALTNFDRLADRLAALPEALHPVRVCVYWWDHHLGHHRPFAERGLEIVSAGHPHDPAFLLRFRILCSMHRYASSDDMSSAVFYAMATGCRFIDIDAEEPTWSYDVWPYGSERYLRLVDLVRRLPEMSDEDQRAIADAHLGRAHLLPADDLRGMLGHAEWLDRIGLIARRPDGRLVPEVPARLRRAVRTWARRAGIGRRPTAARD